MFGYGSLMWRTGFDYLERRQARLIGAHRALCIYSHIHRGTPENSGTCARSRPGRLVPRHCVSRGGGKCERHARLPAGARTRHQGLQGGGPAGRIAGREARARIGALLSRRSLPSAIHETLVARGAASARAPGSRALRRKSANMSCETVKHMRELGIRDRALEWLAARLVVQAARRATFTGMPLPTVSGDRSRNTDSSGSAPPSTMWR